MTVYEKCSKCQAKIPISGLKNHMKACNGKSIKEETPLFEEFKFNGQICRVLPDGRFIPDSPEIRYFYKRLKAGHEI